jgi:hypothetical protein
MRISLAQVAVGIALAWLCCERPLSAEPAGEETVAGVRAASAVASPVTEGGQRHLVIDSGTAQSAGGAEQLASWLDQRLEHVWSTAGITPSLCDDATYLRRVSLDLTGRIPSVAQTRDFLTDPHPAKRSRMVDSLLVDARNPQQNTDAYAAHLARVWRRMMIPQGSPNPGAGGGFEAWLKTQFRENVSYDELARRVVAARGDGSAGVAAFYQATGVAPEAMATSTSRVFLGVRIGCAQCHNHPFASWKQRDFWGLAAYFNGTTVNGAPGLVVAGRMDGSGISDDAASGIIEYQNATYSGAVPWGPEVESIAPNVSSRPRSVLARWMTSPDNRYFAETAVNRVWRHLLGRGLVAAADDLDQAAAEERELVLADLAKGFVESGYNLRWLIAGICQSEAYQCVSDREDTEGEVSVQTARRPLKALTPEQMFDSLEQALHLPLSRNDVASARHNGQKVQMVARLDEGVSQSPDEYAAGIPQALLLMNGPLTMDATDWERSRLVRSVVEAPFLAEESRLDTLFLAVLTRLPSDEERGWLNAHLAEQKSDAERAEAYGEIVWALLNSSEFVLCR